MADTDTNNRPRTELKKRFDFMFKIVLLGDTVSFTEIAGQFSQKEKNQKKTTDEIFHFF